MAFHIVVIDDDLALQEFYRLFLEGEGYHVTIVSPFDFAFDTLTELHADLFILDLLIGNKQAGWSILQNLLDTPSTARLPVILVTALPITTFEASWERCIKQQGIPLILKPFDVDTLLTNIKSLLPNSSPHLEDLAYNDPIG